MQLIAVLFFAGMLPVAGWLIDRFGRPVCAPRHIVRRVVSERTMIREAGQRLPTSSLSRAH
jgi:MFS family permease